MNVKNTMLSKILEKGKLMKVDYWLLGARSEKRIDQKGQERTFRDDGNSILIVVDCIHLLKLNELYI